MSNEDVTQFSAVDRTRDPAFFARFLDAGHTLPAIVAAKALIMDGLYLRGAERVLDVGCGLGIDVCRRGRPRGPSRACNPGRVLSVSLLAEARRRAHGRPLQATFAVGDAQALPCADNTLMRCARSAC